MIYGIRRLIYHFHVIIFYTAIFSIGIRIVNRVVIITASI